MLSRDKCTKNIAYNISLVQSLSRAAVQNERDRISQRRSDVASSPSDGGGSGGGSGASSGGGACGLSMETLMNAYTHCQRVSRDTNPYTVGLMTD